MRSTQVSCPCCGSMLNFGEEIAVGSPVSCLICMQNFVAERVVVSDVAESPAPPSPAVLTMEVPAPPVPPPLPVLSASVSAPMPAVPVGAVAGGKPAVVMPPLPLQVASPAAPVRPTHTSPMVLVGVVLGGMALLVVGGIAVIGLSLLFGFSRTARNTDAKP